MTDLRSLLEKEDPAANRRELPDQIRLSVEEGFVEVRLTFSPEAALVLADDIEFAVKHRETGEDEGY